MNRCVAPVRPTLRNRLGALRRALPALVGAAVVSATIAACAGGGDTTRPMGTAGRHHAGHQQSALNTERNAHPGGDGHTAHAGHAMHDQGEPLGAATDFSLYHLDASWTDQHGAPRQLASLAGRVQVVAMVYTTCAHACPRILADMKRIEGALPREARDRVGFVMVTIDPARDTPEQLASYANAVRLDPANWTLLTAPDNTVLELAALLGVKYRRISETDFSHTNVITILDQQGEIAHRQLGLGADPGATLRVIEQLVRAGA